MDVWENFDRVVYRIQDPWFYLRTQKFGVVMAQLSEHRQLKPKIMGWNFFLVTVSFFVVVFRAFLLFTKPSFYQLNFVDRWCRLIITTFFFIPFRVLSVSTVRERGSSRLSVLLKSGCQVIRTIESNLWGWHSI